MAVNNKYTVRIQIIVDYCLNLSLYMLSAAGTTIILLLWPPCLLYRKLVIIAAKLLRKDLGSILNSNGILLADEDYVKNPSNCSVVAVLRIDGNLTLHTVHTLVAENIVRAKIKDTNKLRYPELQCYPKNYMGYPFWKKDSYFALENHITEYLGTSVVPISKIHQEMLNSKFPRNQSPWQLTIFQNGHQNRTFLAFRIHHSMSDGRSILKLLVECLGNKPLVAKEPRFPTRSIKMKERYLSWLPISFIRIIAFLLKCQLKINGHPWASQKDRENMNQIPLFVGVSGKISLGKIRETARVAQVTTSAMIMCAVTNAMGKFSQLHHDNQTGAAPIYLMLPRRDHPPTLSNHLYFGIPLIPKIDDDIQHLWECNRIYKFMRESDHSRNLARLIDVLTKFPVSMRSKLTSSQVVIAGLSNIAGDQEGFVVGSHPCLGFTMSTGVQERGCGGNHVFYLYCFHCYSEIDCM